VSPAKPIGKMAVARRVRLVVHLDPTIATLLDVTAGHLGKSRDETIADALRALSVAIPRTGDLLSDAGPQGAGGRTPDR
jgi:hypothetical protein